MHDNQPLIITTRPRTRPAIRSLARACVEIAKTQQRQERIIRTLHRLESRIVLGERYDCPSIAIDGQPFIIFDRGTVACKLVGELADRLLIRREATEWSPPGQRVALENWLLLSSDMPERDMLHWAQCALVQAGMRVST